MRRVHRFAVDRSGGAAIEYAVLIAGIALTLAMTATLLGDRMATNYTRFAAVLIATDDGSGDPPRCLPTRAHVGKQKGKAKVRRTVQSGCGG